MVSREFEGPAAEEPKAAGASAGGRCGSVGEPLPKFEAEAEQARANEDQRPSEGAGQEAGQLRHHGARPPKNLTANPSLRTLRILSAMQQTMRGDLLSLSIL